MRLLANENIGASIVRGLRTYGHDVLWAKESMRGADDPAILSRAMIENRLLLTFDKDFGDLAFIKRLPATCGIILFRLSPDTPDRRAEKVLRILLSRKRLERRLPDGHRSGHSQTVITVTVNF
jgi:predicted nuclease of predicted toxin-antitoxin system